MSTKSGFVTIIGKPNVGKSTLMNKLLGEDLSIITSKPQTTRKRILGILSEENYQIIFLDTPGILDPKYLMQEKLADYIVKSVKDADVILFLITLGKSEKELELFEKEETQEYLKNKNKKKILIINKIDLVKQEVLTSAMRKVEKKNIFDEIIPISALEGYNLEKLQEKIIDFLPVHPKFYPDDELTNETERFFVSEKIREKILELYHDEIPYSIEVIIEEFKEREKGKDFISASIVVERESQKPIILGKGGSKIKKLGAAARISVEEFLMRKVYLELRVKVADNWRKDKNALKRFGYLE
ncbi:MAG: GTPase Era [Ignavibacteriae bacterium]|nr:MAG: GTPase Era [Ignavibacteriota bacterium]